MKRAAERKARALRRFRLRSTFMVFVFAMSAATLMGRSAW